MVDLQLDPESVASIATAAIFDQLSQEARDGILKQAIEHLMTPKKEPGAWGGAQTPLQKAFDQAIASAAFKVVREKVESDPDVQARIAELLGPLLNGALVGDDFDGELADVLGRALGSYLAENARKRR